VIPTDIITEFGQLRLDGTLQKKQKDWYSAGFIHEAKTWDNEEI